MYYDDRKIDRAALEARSNRLIMCWNRAPAKNISESNHLKKRAPVVLITGYGSITQNEKGEPQPNVTQDLLDLIKKSEESEKKQRFLPDADITLAVSPTDWLAPIRFHRLAEQIKPHLIINLGQGGSGPFGSVIESGASNFIGAKKDEYDDKGRILSHPQIAGERISSKSNAPSSLLLSWSRLVEDVAPNVFASSARKENSYICNATAWILAASIAGVSLDFFNETFSLKPLDPAIIHGFLHLTAFPAGPDYFDMKFKKDLNLIEALANASLKKTNLTCKNLYF